MANEDNEKVDPAVARAINEVLKKRGKIEEENRLARSEAVKLAKEDLTVAQQAEAAAKKALEQAKQKKDIDQEILAQRVKDVELAERAAAAAEAGLNSIIRKQQVLNKVAKGAPDFLKSIFSGDGHAAITGNMKKIGNSLQSGLTKEMDKASTSAGSLGGKLAKMGAAALAAAVLTLATAVLKLAIELADAEAAFMKTTGASKEFARNLTDSYKETRKFYASLGETSAAMGSLYTGFTDFTFQNDKTIQSLTETGTVLNRLGVSTDDFASSVQTMTKAMGMSAEAAGQQMLDLEKFAENLGVAPSKLAADFANAGNMMSKQFGDQGVEAFKDLQIAMKITGLDMQKILNITDKFDTFEGAAESAGKLNAALGGNFVNAMDLMMETNPADRFGMIRDSILDAGLSFDDMSYYQAKFYAESLGLSDVNDLALVLAGNMDPIPGAVRKSSQEIEEAADRAKDMAKFQDKLNGLMAQMIPILEPVIEMLGGFIESLEAIMPLLIGIGEGFGFAFEGIAIGMKFITDLVGGLENLEMVLKPVGMLLAAAGTLLMFMAGGPIATITAAFVALGAAVSLVHRLMAVEEHSPTFMDSLGIINSEFDTMPGKLDNSRSSMAQLSTTVDSTSIPTVADTMPNSTNNGGSSGAQSSGGDGGMQTVRQPVQLSLNGDKLEKFVVEVLGKSIKNISILQ